MAGDVKSRPQACRRPASSPEFLCPSGEGESVMGDADRPRRGILMAREGEMDQPPSASARSAEAETTRSAVGGRSRRRRRSRRSWRRSSGARAARTSGRSGSRASCERRRHRSRNWLVVHSVLNAFLARVECMDEKAVTNAVFRRAVRAYLIGAGIAIAVAVLLSLGAPLLPLPFAYRLAVLFGGVVTYSAYKRAAAEQRLEAAGQENEGMGAPGWATVSCLCLIVVLGSGLLVDATAMVFKLITGGEQPV